MEASERVQRGLPSRLLESQPPDESSQVNASAGTEPISQPLLATAEKIHDNSSPNRLPSSAPLPEPRPSARVPPLAVPPVVSSPSPSAPAARPRSLTTRQSSDFWEDHHESGGSSTLVTKEDTCTTRSTYCGNRDVPPSARGSRDPQLSVRGSRDASCTRSCTLAGTQQPDEGAPSSTPLAQDVPGTPAPTHYRRQSIEFASLEYPLTNPPPPSPSTSPNGAANGEDGLWPDLTKGPVATRTLQPGTMLTHRLFRRQSTKSEQPAEHQVGTTCRAPSLTAEHQVRRQSTGLRRWLTRPRVSVSEAPQSSEALEGRRGWSTVQQVVSEAAVVKGLSCGQQLGGITPLATLAAQWEEHGIDHIGPHWPAVDSPGLEYEDPQGEIDSIFDSMRAGGANGSRDKPAVCD